MLVKAAHYIAPKASVNSPRLSKVTGCRPSKRRDVYSFSILSISISFSILKFLSQSLLWICSSSFLLPLEYKSRSVLLPLFLRQNLDDFWLDDFWIVLLDCEVTLENANAIRIALHPTLPLMERSRLQTAHH